MPSWKRTCYRELTGTCHQEPAPRAIRNPGDRIPQANQRLPPRLTQNLTHMSLTLLKLATARTGENSEGVRHDRGTLPSGHAHPHRIDLARAADRALDALRARCCRADPRSSPPYPELRAR